MNDSTEDLLGINYFYLVPTKDPTLANSEFLEELLELLTIFDCLHFSKCASTTCEYVIVNLASSCSDHNSYDVGRIKTS